MSVVQRELQLEIGGVILSLLHLAVIFPFAMGILLTMLNRFFRRIHMGWPVLIVPVLLFSYFASLIPAVSQRNMVSGYVPWIPSLDIGFNLYLDGLSLLLTLLITGIGVLVVFYSIYYMDKKEDLNRFYLYLLMFMGAMLGVVLSDNMIVLYGFWELTSITSFLLIAFHYKRKASTSGAQKSFLITVFGGFAMLAGFMMMYLMTGTFSIRATITEWGQIQDSALFLPALVLILIGAFTKSAQFPFHIWLPDAMEAPTPVSAYLHSATMVKAGLYVIARFTPIFGGEGTWFWLVTGVGLLTLCYGSFLAVKKNDLKAILAYSTISQLGLIMSLLGIGSAALYFGYGESSAVYTVAITAALLHLFNHATFKAALFMVVGIVDHETGTRDIRKLGGLASFMPVTFTVALVGALAMAGIPPFNGFLSKELFFQAMVEVTHLRIFGLGSWSILLPVLAWLASVFTLIYALIIVFKTFLGNRRTELPAEKLHEAPVGMLIPPVILGVLVITFGLFPDLLAGSLIEPAMASVLPALLDGNEHFDVHFSLWHGITPELIMTIGVIILGITLYKLLPRWRNVYEHYPQGLTINNMYHVILDNVQHYARKWTEAYMNGSVRNYLVYIFSFTVALLVYAFFRSGENITWNFKGHAPFSFYEAVLLVALIAAAVSIPFAKNRLSAVIMTGAVGYLVTLLFVLFRAPDLALTQMIVETVSVALFLLCFYHLPELQRGRSSRKYLSVNMIVAIAVGIVMTFVALAASGTASLESISNFFVQESYNLAGGKNVVNVLLVDFRGFDTILEIMVLGVASLSIYSMINLNLEAKDLGARLKFRKKEESKDDDNLDDEADNTKKYGNQERSSSTWDTVPLQSNDVLLQTTTKVVVFIILTFALHLFFAGHHNPGGGFIGGLVTAAALVLIALAFSTDTVRKALPIDFRTLTAVGLAIALLTGAGSFLFGVPFLSQTFGYFELPLLGETELATAMLFDLGVYIAVLGVTMTIILQIGEDR
ncbi:Na+/H+ antiporter subunit A [Paenibacillus illinoisensis]|uniref:Na+/H+ antiporter subunit A n=1 Tax=Paenibacillus illinoisensis TaxID=59845 RepID=UPI003D298974